MRGDLDHEYINTTTPSRKTFRSLEENYSVAYSPDLARFFRVSRLFVACRKRCCGGHSRAQRESFEEGGGGMTLAQTP
jgi:hypothetical protein